jgi:toxin ParE1/3/4
MEPILPLVRRSRRSDHDYAEIWHYIAFDNPRAADEMLRRIDERLALYALQPRMGTDRSELVRGLRSFPIGNYLAFYRDIAGGIELVRVLHGARKLTRKLFR